MHVSIVGLGPTSAAYVDYCKRLGDRRRFCDETWVINGLGPILDHDLMFHMDDVRIQAIRAAADPGGTIAHMLEWMKTHHRPIVTSIAHRDFPALVEFPLEEVINEFRYGYFNSTAAYAVAYAIHKNVSQISVWGMDFTYPDAHDAEKGRACVEYWLGVATQRGIHIAMPQQTSLMDSMYTHAQRFYGYDCVDLDFRLQDGRFSIAMKEKEDFPTDAAIEEAYRHDKHPNGMMIEVPADA